MNNAVVFNEKHKLSQREPKNKTLSSPEIYNPSPIFKNRSISTNLPLFVEVNDNKEGIVFNIIGNT